MSLQNFIILNDLNMEDAFGELFVLIMGGLLLIYFLFCFISSERPENGLLLSVRYYFQRWQPLVVLMSYIES